MFAQTKHALINTNSDYFERVAESAKDAENVITFGTKPGSDILGYDIKKLITRFISVYHVTALMKILH